MWQPFHKAPVVYLCKNLRTSCLAMPSSSQAFAYFTLNFSALRLISCPFSSRHKSIVCRISIPTASRVPFGVSPFLCMGLRPSPVLTWKSSKATLRFSERCTAAVGWSAAKGQQILRKKVKHQTSIVDRRKNPYKGIPLPRDSVTLLIPACVMNHPVAYGEIFILSIEPRQVEKRDIIPGDSKRIAVGTM